MKNTHKKAIILFIISLGAVFFLNKGSIKKFFDTKLDNTGWYYSDFLEEAGNYSNTNNLKEIGASKVIDEADRLSIKFPEGQKGDIYIRILGGYPKPDKVPSKVYNRLFISSENIKTEHHIIKPTLNYLTKRLSDNGSGFILKLSKDESEKEGFIIRRIEVSKVFDGVLPGIGKLLALAILPVIIFYLVTLKYDKSNFKIVIFLIILTAAVFVRWNEVMRLSGLPITGDGLEYAEFSQQMKLFTDDGFYSAKFGHREPFYILAVKGIYKVIGFSHLHVRFASFILGIISLIAVFAVGSKVYNSFFIGIGSMFLVGFSNNLIYEQSRGMRTEFETILFLLFIFIAGFYKGRSFLRWIFYTTIVALMLVLTRLGNIFSVSILTLIGFIARKLSIKKFISGGLLISLIIFVGVFPHQLRMMKKYNNNPIGNWSSDATYSAMLEGVITKDFDNFEANLPIQDWLFKYHTKTELLKCGILGTISVSFNLVGDALNMAQRMNYLSRSILKLRFDKLFDDFPGPVFLCMGILFFLIGLILSFRDIRLFIIPAAFILVPWYNIIFHGITILKGRFILDLHRTILHAVPFAAFIILFGLKETVIFFKKKVLKYG